MKPQIILHSAFLTWLRRVWVRAFTPARKTRKRYPRPSPTRHGFVFTPHTGTWREILTLVEQHPGITADELCVALNRQTPAVCVGQMAKAGVIARRWNGPHHGKATYWPVKKLGG